MAVDDTVDMFPDMPRDPDPEPEDQLPRDVQDAIKGLRKLVKEKHRTQHEKMVLEQAARLLVEGWSGGTP